MAKMKMIFNFVLGLSNPLAYDRAIYIEEKYL